MDQDIIQNALNDAYFTARIISDIKKSIKSFPRVTLLNSKPKIIEFPPDFQVPIFKVTSDIEQMISIATSIGKTCASRYCYNQRLIRSFGFCVMYLASQFKKGSFLSWNNIIEEIVLIISYADLRNYIEMNEFATKSFYLKSSTYYLWKGFQKSNRFGYLLPIVYQKLKKAFLSEDNDESFPLASIIPIENIEDIYKISQSEIIYSDFWEFRGHELPLPSIVYKNIGVYGFELFVRSSFEGNPENSYQSDISDAFDRMQTMTNRHSMIDAVAELMTLIFVYNPVSHFSPEIAQIILHAFLIVNFDLDIGKFEIEKQEMFIEQMLDPNPRQIATKLLEDIHKNQKEHIMNDFCFNFWKELPSVADMLSLYLVNKAVPHDLVLEPKEIPLD